MPELPEVETIRRGITPHVCGREIRYVLVRDRRLRWPVPGALEDALTGRDILSIRRRGKYLIFDVQNGYLLIHLGMSGRLQLVATDEPHGPYDHVELCLAGGTSLRLRDPRRFGCVIWIDRDPDQHPLLRNLGPEPLERSFTGDYLYELSRNRSTSIKNFLMDGRVVAGLGNIYVNEALFEAGIHPARAARRISRARYRSLARAIKQTLRRALAAGGTTLRDFSGANGEPGYFRLELAVYGRAGEPCPRCGRAVQRRLLGQRSSFLCTHCQR